MSLLDKENNELCNFKVDLSCLEYLDKDLRKVSIYTYPIIIFEFMTGYFTTKELYEENKSISYELAQDFEIMEIPKELQKGLRPTATMAPKDNILLSASTILPTIEESNENEIPKKNLNLDNKPLSSNLTLNKSKSGNGKNSEENNNNINNLANETATPKNEKKKNLAKSVLPVISREKKKWAGLDKKISYDSIKHNNKIQCTPYFNYIKDYQMLSFYINPQENIKETNQNLAKELEIFEEGLEKYKRKLRIIKMNKQIEFLKKKNEAIKELTKDLEEAIKHKQTNSQKVSSLLKPNQTNYDNKITQLKNNLNGRGQYQLIYDSFVYQKMAEVCFIFFNNKIQSLYTIPKFYNEPILINDTKKMERLEYYNNNKKTISAMMGHICQLLIYLSKTFNIPLRFPIFLNGSRSYILRSVKDKMFLPLYLDPKKEDKHGSFENALNCLKDDIKEIFNFLSMFPEIISQSDNENINNMNGKYLFFFFFVVFNHSLFRFMKTLQNAV